MKFNGVEFIRGVRCGVCGGRVVRVRPREPGGAVRNVCPTCMADRLAEIHYTSSEVWGVASAYRVTADTKK